MNAGIIVYSQTGNTLSVAEKLKQALEANGHTVNIGKVEASGEDPGSPASIKLESAPDITPYDYVIFASPVHAFSLAPAMKTYLSQVSSLTGKKVCCFVTQQLKKAWMGGNRAVRQIETACKVNGADIIESGVVNWSSNTRDKQIDDIVERFCQL
jgi:flavodoxin